MTMISTPCPKRVRLLHLEEIRCEYHSEDQHEHKVYDYNVRRSMSVLKSSDEIIEGIDDTTGVPREWGASP